MKQKILKICLAFFIPLAILILFYLITGIGTENTFLVSDMQAQYVALFKYLREFSFSDCFYLLNKGLGGGMFGTITYYLSSPLNFIIYLFPKSNVFLAIITLITLKISLSGLTMYTYLKYKYKTDSWKLLLFSTCYALMSYNINYYFHIILDGVMILPIVMLGIERILQKKSSIVYILSLVYAIMSNYYIGYMICIASVLYFIFELFHQYKWKTDKKEMFKIFIRYAISSLLSGLICMVILIPTLIELQSGYKADSFGIGSGLGFHFNFLDIWSRSYIGSHNYSNVLSKQTINIYCGLFILPLLYFFFINKNIKIRTKIIYGIFFLVLSLGVYFDMFNMIWHAFNSANCFNYRYSFIIMFIMIAVATHSFLEIEKIDLKHYLIFLISYLAMSLAMMFKEYNYVSYVNIYISIGCMMLYLALLYNYIRYTKNKDIKVLLFVIVFAELFCNMFMSLRNYENYSIKEYNFYNNNLGNEIRKLQGDTYLYRLEKSFDYTSNDGMLIGYNGITTFLSTTNSSVLNFSKKVGYDTRLIISDTGKNSYIMDAILGVKYRINDIDLDLYEKIDTLERPMFSGNLFHETGVKDISVFENPYALSLGYMINSKNNDQEESIKIDDNAFEYQNYILNTMLGNDTKYFKSYSKEKLGEAYYRFTIDNDELVYIFIPFDLAGEMPTIKVNNVNFGSLSQIAKYEKNLNGEKIDVLLNGKVSSYGEIQAYYFDEESFVNDIKKLQENTMKFETLDNGHIKGKVVATKEMPILFLSIPLDQGWKLYVDGKETEIELLYDTFMGVSLEEGEHEIELKYSVPGLKTGIVVSIISLTLTIIYLYFEKKSSKKVK